MPNRKIWRITALLLALPALLLVGCHESDWQAAMDWLAGAFASLESNTLSDGQNNSLLLLNTEVTFGPSSVSGRAVTAATAGAANSILFVGFLPGETIVFTGTFNQQGNNLTAHNLTRFQEYGGENDTISMDMTVSEDRQTLSADISYTRDGTVFTGEGIEMARVED